MAKKPTNDRNVLYLIREQYIEWGISASTFMRKQTQAFQPTPVSNIIRDYVRSTKALILNKDFRMNVWPNTDEQADRDAAKIGEDLLQHMDLENDEEFFGEREKAAEWILLAGTSFIRVFPAMDRGAFGFDKSGNPIPTGEVAAENLLPFNVIVDLIGERLRDKPRIGIKSLKPKEWVEDSFKIELKDDTNSQEIDYQRRLMTMVSNVSPWTGSGLESQIVTMPNQDLVLFKEVEYQPTKEFPKGRYVVVAGGQVAINAQRLPIPTTEQAGFTRWDYSITDFHYNYVPGRFWSDAGVNDQISPQNTINSIDQDLEMNRKGIGRPLVMHPSDIELRRENVGGQSFIMLSYDGLEAGGQRPTVDRGTPLPQQVLAERAIHQGVSQDAAGNPKNVLRGEAPSARASGVLVDELQEAAEESHVPDISRFWRSMQGVYRKRLIMANELYTEERMIKIAGKGTGPKIRAFRSADLRDNTDVRITVASGIASTSSGKVSMVMRLLESGGFLFSKLGEDPELQNLLLTRLGLDDFGSEEGVDIDRAFEENARLANGNLTGIFLAEGGDDPENPEVQMMDLLFKHDNHIVHYKVHRRFILGDEFKTLDEKTQAVAVNHTENHELVMKQNAAAAAEAEIKAEQAKRVSPQAPPPAAPV